MNDKANISRNLNPVSESLLVKKTMSRRKLMKSILVGSALSVGVVSGSAGKLDYLLRGSGSSFVRKAFAQIRAGTSIRTYGGSIDTTLELGFEYAERETGWNGESFAAEEQRGGGAIDFAIDGNNPIGDDPHSSRYLYRDADGNPYGEIGIVDEVELNVLGDTEKENKEHDFNVDVTTLPGYREPMAFTREHPPQPIQFNIPVTVGSREYDIHYIAFPLTVRNRIVGLWVIDPTRETQPTAHGRDKGGFSFFFRQYQDQIGLDRSIEDEKEFSVYVHYNVGDAPESSFIGDYSYRWNLDQAGFSINHKTRGLREDFAYHQEIWDILTYSVDAQGSRPDDKDRPGGILPEDRLPGGGVPTTNGPIGGGGGEGGGGTTLDPNDGGEGGEGGGEGGGGTTLDPNDGGNGGEGGSGGTTIRGGSGGEGGGGGTTIRGGSGGEGGGGGTTIRGGSGGEGGGGGGTTLDPNDGGNGGEGGSGGTTIRGGSGGTTIRGGSGGTTIRGGSGGTTIRGGSGGTTIRGGSGGTTTRAPTGGTTIRGGSGGTTTRAPTGGTTIRGGSGGTTTRAPTGGTTIRGGSGGTTIRGGSGGTTTRAPTGGTTTRAPTGGTTIRGGSGGTTIRGGSGGTTTRAPTGGTTIRGGSGGTTTRAPTGGTTIRGGSGGTTIRGGSGGTTMAATTLATTAVVTTLATTAATTLPTTAATTLPTTAATTLPTTAATTLPTTAATTLPTTAATTLPTTAVVTTLATTAGPTDTSDTIEGFGMFNKNWLVRNQAVTGLDGLRERMRTFRSRNLRGQ